MTPRDLIAQLINYLMEQAKIVDPRVFRLSVNERFQRRRDEVAGLPGVEFDRSVEGDHLWLRVERLKANKAPEPPSKAKGLIHITEDPEGAKPSIDESVLAARVASELPAGTTAEREKHGRRLRNELEPRLREYTLLWEAWAEGERPRRRTINLYGDLFALMKQLETEESTKPSELVWGVGVATWLLNWEESQGRKCTVEFEYPLLTQQMEISLDSKSMAILLRPRTTDTNYEGDAFAACLGREAAEVELLVREQLKRNVEHPVTPFDPGSYSDLLKLVAGNLDSEGSYQPLREGENVVPPSGKHLVVTDAWVLFVRPRSNNSFLQDLQRLKQRLLDGCPIPAGPGSLVTIPSSEPTPFASVCFRGISSRGGGQGKVHELYFPLPYNQEQETIIQQLESGAGVTVQGPPGTGKTHTIANIICHYLATGKRILVTSSGEHALEVLQAKIPEEVRPLTVALLTNDREGLRQFEHSINKIQAEVSQLNPELTRQSIANCTSQIDHTHAELARIDQRIDGIAREQLSEFLVDGQVMRAQTLADLVVDGQAEHGWFEDPVTLAPEHAPPLSEAEGGRLREVRRRLGSDLVYVQARIPAADDLPPPLDVAKLHEIMIRMQAIQRQVGDGSLSPLRATTAEVLDAARQLLEAVDRAMKLHEELEELGETWPHELRAKCRLPAFNAERAAFEALFADIDALTTARACFLQRPVELSGDAFRSAKVRDAIQRAAQTGKPFGLVSFGNGDVKEVLAGLRIAGLPPETVDDWRHVHQFLELHVRVTSFVTRWNEFAPLLDAPSLSNERLDLRRIEMVASAARKAHQLATQHDLLLVRRSAEVFVRPPAQELTGSRQQLNSVREQLVTHLTQAELQLAATQLSTLKSKLAGISGPVSVALLKFIGEELGCEGLAAQRVAADYAQLIGELRRIQSLNADLGFVREVASRLEQSGAPKLGERVRNIPVAPTGEDTAFPAGWLRAWTWARAKTHLERIEAREELVRLSASRRDLEQKLSRLYREMVAQSAWLETKRNASPRVLQALQGYATAIRKIGQGTGPNATRYRRDARNHMEAAVDAVPCWILSHAKISETVPAEIGAFDLVIVDEASQSDLKALPSILRGKKLLVVGDDKQVSPTGGFISAERIQELRERFLRGQPFQEDMTLEKSLYDLAARVFADRQVMLREHFRCVPPIIAYSNRTYYNNQIRPLRIPTATERIDPPLVDVLVEDGIRDRHDCNHAEAKYIAEEVVSLLKDARLAQRTIGVVSLLGMNQARCIDAKVREKCSPEDLLKCRFECGDAATFQGSERDIVFISMVAAAGNCKALSGNVFEQRFNVAASRARDRIYLVRSVTAEALSDRDIRLGLLRHFDNPVVANKEEVENLIKLCESGFEREVYSELAQRGYRVVPQVKSGAFRIDMVVEGTGDLRLAIECDGDAYHGPDRWHQDMLRQRTLERVGWIFWRCFASTWRLRKDEVVAELIERLKSMGIEPLGALSSIPQVVEKRCFRAHVDPPESS